MLVSGLVGGDESFHKSGVREPLMQVERPRYIAHSLLHQVNATYGEMGTWYYTYLSKAVQALNT